MQLNPLVAEAFGYLQSIGVDVSLAAISMGNPNLHRANLSIAQRTLGDVMLRACVSEPRASLETTQERINDIAEFCMHAVVYGQSSTLDARVPTFSFKQNGTDFGTPDGGIPTGYIPIYN